MTTELATQGQQPRLPPGGGEGPHCDAPASMAIPAGHAAPPFTNEMKPLPQRAYSGLSLGIALDLGCGQRGRWTWAEPTRALQLWHSLCRKPRLLAFHPGFTERTHCHDYGLRTPAEIHSFDPQSNPPREALQSPPFHRRENRDPER